MGTRQGKAWGWKVWPALALACVMALPGAAASVERADSARSTAANLVQPAAGRASPAVSVAVQGPDARLRQARPVASMVIAARRPQAADAGGGWPRLSAVDQRSAPVGIAKSHALVLSSLGMLGVIALHRLTRSF